MSKKKDGKQRHFFHALKVLLKKIKGTDVELLLQESGLIER